MKKVLALVLSLVLVVAFTFSVVGCKKTEAPAPAPEAPAAPAAPAK